TTSLDGIEVGGSDTPRAIPPRGRIYRSCWDDTNSPWGHGISRSAPARHRRRTFMPTRKRIQSRNSTNSVSIHRLGGATQFLIAWKTASENGVVFAMTPVTGIS